MRWWFTHIPALLSIISWFHLNEPQSSPSTCVTTSRDLIALVKCLDTFTVLPQYYDEETYQDAQPTGIQRRDWKATINSLLHIDGNCSSISVPGSLSKVYSIQLFTPLGSERSYCTLLEKSVDCNGYPLGWGHFIVPATRSQVSRDIHLSAPHPKYDVGTLEQAAALFELSGARSLLLAGRTRTAFMEPSNCIRRQATTLPFYKTDPAHNKVRDPVDSCDGD